MNEAASQEALDEGAKLVAETRRRCAELGLSPRHFAEILLPEALLACMIAGMQQEEVEALFADFARDEIPQWFVRVKRTVGFCDCAREAMSDHAAGCASLITINPQREQAGHRPA